METIRSVLKKKPTMAGSAHLIKLTPMSKGDYASLGSSFFASSCF